MVSHGNLLASSKYVEDGFLGVWKGLKFAARDLTRSERLRTGRLPAAMLCRRNSVATRESSLVHSCELIGAFRRIATLNLFIDGYKIMI
jgi:hypothetical protein